MSDQKDISPLMHELSIYIAGAIKRKLPAEVVERAKLHLLDTFASMIAGSALLPGKRARTYIKPLVAKREAGVIGTRIITSSLNAALANGMSGHADETDDTHPPSRTHPGTSVIPAALAIAERQGLSGKKMLRAVVLGYDICARTLLALAPKPALRPACCNVSFGQLFGSAAAAAALLNLNEQKVRYVLAYAGQQASGLFTRLRDLHHIEKAYSLAGMPAHNGILAALMVKSGFTGVEDVFSGEDNFFLTYAPNADREALVRGLGQSYEIMRAGIKRWCAGGPVQAPLHVLNDLIRRYGFKAGEVEKLTVRIPGTELQIVDNRDMPNISLQHLLAVMLLDGTLTFAAAHDLARMKDPRVTEVRRCIEAVSDATIPYAVRGWRCTMEIMLRDGHKLTHETMAAKGSFENPLTRNEVEEKAIGLIEPMLGKQRCGALMAAVRDIENTKDMRVFRRLYAT